MVVNHDENTIFHIKKHSKSNIMCIILAQLIKNGGVKQVLIWFIFVLVPLQVKQQDPHQTNFIFCIHTIFITWQTYKKALEI